MVIERQLAKPIFAWLTAKLFLFHFTYTSIYVSLVFMGKEEESKNGGWVGRRGSGTDVGVWIDDEDVHWGDG